jgi:hypothetical protein
MKRPSAALVAHWYAEAAASGFHDLETGDKLSNRGTPTRTGVIEQAAYYEKMAAAEPTRLAALPPMAARIWALHVAKVPIRGIASRLRHSLRGRAGGRFERVRKSIIETRRALLGNQARESEQVDEREQCETAKPLRMLRSLDLDTQTLVELIALLSGQTRRKRCSPTSSSSSGPTWTT